MLRRSPRWCVAELRKVRFVGVEKLNLKLTSGVDDPSNRAAGTITVNIPSWAEAEVCGRELYQHINFRMSRSHVGIRQNLVAAATLYLLQQNVRATDR
jgi:hypothetical protein